MPLSQTSPPEFAKHQSEFAKQQEAPASREETARPATEHHEADERQVQLRAIASDLLSWKGSLKALRQAQLPKRRGFFQWQIEAKIGLQGINQVSFASTPPFLLTNWPIMIYTFR